MSGAMEIALRIAAVGIGATAFMDIWAAAQLRLFGIPSLDYRMVGRWLGHMPQGRFIHDTIGHSPAIRGEGLIGWAAHYAIGIVFAAILTGLAGTDWLAAPTLWPALLFGLMTVAAPFFLLQPGMGAGLAATRTSRPNLARLRSLIAHASFGLGLYLAAVLSVALFP